MRLLLQPDHEDAVLVGCGQQGRRKQGQVRRGRSTGRPRPRGSAAFAAPDPNAICLVTTWLGYTDQNGDGRLRDIDFGTQGHVLCDFDLQLLPSGREALGCGSTEKEKGHMRSRGLVVAIAVVLAVLAAVGVIVYTSSVRETAVDENTTTVLASTQDIQANTPLDPLIAQGVFQTIQVPNDGVVPGRGDRCVAAPGTDRDRADLPERADPARRASPPGASNILRHRSRQHRARAARSRVRPR